MRRNGLFLLAALLGGSAGCAETVPAEWPKECVGRLQLALPGEADQGAILGSERFRNRAQYGQPSPRFPDGEESGWSEFLGMEISHPLTNEEKIQATRKLVLRKTETLIKDIKIDSQRIVWRKLIDRESMAYGSSYRIFDTNFLISNGVYLSWGTSARDEAELLQSKMLLRTIAAGLRPRQLFDVPTEPGLCLPYVFIPDSGQEKHAIAMTYRLKEHPDITVNLKSETAEPTPKPGGDIRPDAVTNDFRTDLYWGTVTAPGRLKSARSLWHVPARRSVQLAGRPGQETFLAVVRKNAAEEDFIYLAVARGNPDAPEAAPDIRFFVEQKRENAIKRGIQPLTQDEVLKLARQIAASVGPRRGQ